MRAARYDQIYIIPAANHARTASQLARLRLVDQEFGDDYRNPRLPAGWFILPSVLVALMCLFII